MHSVLTEKIEDEELDRRKRRSGIQTKQKEEYTRRQWNDLHILSSFYNFVQNCIEQYQILVISLKML